MPIEALSTMCTWGLSVAHPCVKYNIFGFLYSVIEDFTLWDGGGWVLQYVENAGFNTSSEKEYIIVNSGQYIVRAALEEWTIH